MNTRLLSPDDLRHLLLRRYQNQHRQWLMGKGKWPWYVSLGSPNAGDLKHQPERIHHWVKAWQSWKGAGELIWRERHWRIFGTQVLPEKCIFTTPSQVATEIGEITRWQQACMHYQQFIDRWPSIQSELGHYFDFLADNPPQEIIRLQTLLTWLLTHPQSQFYPRQLPIPGVDSKWLEERKTLVAPLLQALQGNHNESDKNLDFFEYCGLKQPPLLIRMRILDPQLRQQLGNFSDMIVPLTELATLTLPITHVFIVENLQTGLAFTDLPNTVVIMGLGYCVDLLAKLPWLQTATCTYWGDCDTHGFAILDRARKHLPHLTSLLMDEKTLLDHQDFWVKEPKPHSAMILSHLISSEQQLYTAIKTHYFGQSIRLEQERIAWDYAWQKISCYSLRKQMLF